jgi:hypothetical protein
MCPYGEGLRGVSGVGVLPRSEVSREGRSWWAAVQRERGPHVPLAYSLVVTAQGHYPMTLKEHDYRTTIIIVKENFHRMTTLAQK